jgi:hypothetical protein
MEKNILLKTRNFRNGLNGSHNITWGLNILEQVEIEMPNIYIWFKMTNGPCMTDGTGITYGTVGLTTPRPPQAYIAPTYAST